MVVALFGLIVGFGFKISAVPFHFWAPDTYEGAPTPVTAYLSVNSKAAGFVAFLLIMYQALPEHLRGVGAGAVDPGRAVDDGGQPRRPPADATSCGFSPTPRSPRPGSCSCPLRRRPWRVQTSPRPSRRPLVYLVIYAVMNLGAFAVVIAGARKTRSGEIRAWSGSPRSTSGWRSCVAVFFFSLAGIPPLAGWFAKFAMFRSVIIAGGTATVTLAAIAAVNSVIAFYYYARVVKAVWLDDPVGEFAPDVEAAPAGSLRLALLVSLVITVAIGFFPAIATFVGNASRVIATGG